MYIYKIKYYYFPHPIGWKIGQLAETTQLDVVKFESRQCAYNCCAFNHCINRDLTADAITGDNLISKAR